MKINAEDAGPNTPIIYSTTRCPRCNDLKKWCDEEGYAYVSVNLEENLDKLEEHKNANRRALPIIEKNGEFHTGPKGAQEFILG